MSGGDSGDSQHYDDDDHQESDANPFARIASELESLSLERQRLLDLMAAKDLELTKYKHAQEQAQQTMQSQSDEIEELGSQVSDLTKSAGQ